MDNYQIWTLVFRVLNIVATFIVAFLVHKVWRKKDDTIADLTLARAGKKLFLKNMKKQLLHPTNYTLNHISKRFGKGLKSIGLSFYEDPSHIMVFIDAFGEVERIKLNK